MAATAAACRISLCVAQRSIHAAWRVSGPAVAPREPRFAVHGSLKQVANLTSSALRSALENKNALGLAHSLSHGDIPALENKDALGHAHCLTETCLLWKTRMPLGMHTLCLTETYLLWRTRMPWGMHTLCLTETYLLWRTRMPWGMHTLCLTETYLLWRTRMPWGTRTICTRKCLAPCALCTVERRTCLEENEGFEASELCVIHPQEHEAGNCVPQAPGVFLE
jgi:hypothetical protein